MPVHRHTHMICNCIGSDLQNQISLSLLSRLPHLLKVEMIQNQSFQDYYPFQPTKVEIVQKSPFKTTKPSQCENCKNSQSFQDHYTLPK